MLLSFHVQLPTHILHERKLHFIAYKSIRVFSIRSVHARSFELLNKVDFRATADSKLEEQSFCNKKNLLLEGEKHCHNFQRLQKRFPKNCISRSIFIAGVTV